MSEFQQISQDREAALKGAYERQRIQLSALLKDGREINGVPKGDYAHPVFGAGNVCAKTLFIGEAPGREEAASGTPFVGKAGKQLDALLELAKISRGEAYVTNVVKYRPVVYGERSQRNRTPGRQEVLDALELLKFEILTIVPRHIVTLGNTPLKAVLALADQNMERADGGSKKAAAQEGGFVQTIGAMHGRPVELTIGSNPMILFALYHPASGIYNPSLVPVMKTDILALGEHLVKAQ